MKEPLTDIFWLVAKETHNPSVEPEVLRDITSLPQSKQRKNKNGVLRRTCSFLSWVWTSD